MALEDPMSRREHGVSPLTHADLTGSRTQDGRGVNLPIATYENAGPTPNLLGVEPNTNWTWEGNTGEPMVQIIVAGESPIMGPAFVAPQDSKGDVEGPAPDGWTTSDSGISNSSLPEPQVGSFTKFGEKYPGSDNG